VLQLLCQWFLVGLTLPTLFFLDNTNWRAGGLEGRVSKWKTWIFGGLHRRQKGGPEGCRKGRSGGLQKRVGRRPALMCSGLAALYSWPCNAARQPTENSCFSFRNTALQPSRPADPLFCVIRFFLCFFSGSAKVLHLGISVVRLRLGFLELGLG